MTLKEDFQTLAEDMQMGYQQELTELGKRLCQGSLNHQADLDFGDLIGSVINDVGFHPLADEGGLSIDYEKDGIKKRIVLGFTELGMWKYFQGLKK